VIVRIQDEASCQCIPDLVLNRLQQAPQGILHGDIEVSKHGGQPGRLQGFERGFQPSQRVQHVKMRAGVWGEF
jgi:hypothetical protein